MDQPIASKMVITGGAATQTTMSAGKHTNPVMQPKQMPTGPTSSTLSSPAAVAPAPAPAPPSIAPGASSVIATISSTPAIAPGKLTQSK